ncbi:MAG TPA: carboxypeptidase-like regulatory domain-containing protein [Bryobacteraceae bacterium]|nr:carboxypeptidase-like regulatory domain-containing protein [Bryobacteraceae bacterium]
MRRSHWLTSIHVSRFFFGLSIVALGILLSFTATPAWSQVTLVGSIVGQVVDQQNAAVPGAEIKVFDATTNSSQTTLTNDAGRYIFVNVPPGVYDISFGKIGFAGYKIDRQQVDVGVTLTLNATLNVGQTTTTVEVTAAAGAELQTMTATVGQTITGQQLASLPTLGRDANAFYTLQPGVLPTGQVAGSVADQNMYQLDGGNNSSDMDGNYSVYTNPSGSTAGGTGGTPSGVMPTPIESIEEFRVGTNNQTADFNGAAGGQVMMVTRRGTNQFHGSGYEYYFSSNVGGANQWKNNHTLLANGQATPTPIGHQNRFGGSIGGQLIPKSILGGKTYVFFNYEGRRFPQVSTVERNVPTPLMRLGVIQVLNSAGQYVAYNLNPTPVTYNGVTYAPAACPAGSCDPRGLGLNPIVSKIWNTQMPLPNDPQGGDTVNTQGFLGNVPLPLHSNFAVGRIDHDFGARNRFFASYRYYKFLQLSSVQTDIGGVLPGDTLGTYSAKAVRPQQPSYWVGGLTSTLSPTTTNDFRFSYLRNFWQWGTVAAPPQLPGLGGALEINGDNSNALNPVNVDAQDARQRFWDGQDKVIRDDLTMIKGNHLFQFGGTYQRNYDYHLRNDNGVGIMNSAVYQINSGSGVTLPSQYIPGTVPTSQLTNYNTLYNDVLGIVSQPQYMYTRAGQNLNLQPLGSYMFDQSIIPYYSVYYSDTWRVKPSFTLTYGLSYQIEMPPYEINGKQVQLVDQSGNPVDIDSFLQARQRAALAGQTSNPTYNPVLGFATVRNVGTGNKYPFDPFYGGFSPRVAAAWNPSADNGFLGHLIGHGKTVIRGGYSRIYGRLNGVNLVLVPLLGTGLGQAVSCIGASMTGQCLGPAGVDPTNAFRIGADGLTAPLPAVSPTLPQPYYPGVGGSAAAGDGSGLDPKIKPNRSDQFDLTIQRELSTHVSFEVGYIGRILRNEFQETNVDAVPFMTTLNGQSFAQAFSNVYWQLWAGASPASIPVQPFFEAALGGANSATCSGSGSCTAFVANNQKSNITTTRVYDMWAALNKLSSWTLGRTMPSTSNSVVGGNVAQQISSFELINSQGWSNYNGGFFSLKMRNWHGLTAVSNFTFNRSLGTGAYTQSTSSYTALNPWDLHSMYGPQPFDIRFVYNLTMFWTSSSLIHGHGLLHHVLGGWNIAPLFTAQSGVPLAVSISGGANTNCQSFGEINCSSGNTNGHENAPLVVPFTGGNSANYNVTVASGAGINGNATRGGSGINMFTDPNAIFGEFRRLVLGYDTSGGGNGNIRGFPTWNVDAQVTKDFSWRERVGATFSVQITNVLNHFQASNPTLSLDTPASFGVVTSQSNTPRQMEFGIRLHF